MTSASPLIPELSDEIIGAIFDHITPNGHLAKDDNEDALKAACLVSHRFGYYGRRGLYPSIEVLSHRSAKHYLQLCRRHPDMGYHIKRFNVAGEDAWDTQVGAKTLSALLEFLTGKGSVRTIRILFEVPWDKWIPSLQASLVKLIIARQVHVLELGNICECFPFKLLPVPWLCKRLTINPLVDKSSNPSTWRAVCSQKGPTSEIVKLSRSAEQRNSRFSSATLNSLWIEAYSITAIAPFAIYPGSTRLVEISCHGVSDSSLPSIIDLLDTSSETMESIIFNIMVVSTSNSPNLSRFANLDLPRLKSLTIVSTVDKIFHGASLKSLAWLFLHMKKSKKLRPKRLNIAIAQSVQPILNPSPNSVFATSPQHGFIDGVFQSIDFFKLDTVISSILHPEGTASIWVMFANIPMNYHKLLVNRRIEASFPTLHTAHKIQGFVGTVAELMKLSDGLSISPKELFVPTYDATKHIGPSEEEVCMKYPELRPGHKIDWAARSRARG